MANVILQRGLLSSIKNKQPLNGTLSVAQDTGQIFLDDDLEHIIVAEKNYIKSVTYPISVDNNGSVSIADATTSNGGLMSATDKTALDTHISNNDAHLSQEERDWLNTKMRNKGNIVLQDSATKTNYILSIDQGVLKLSEGSSDLESISPTLVDQSLGTSYKLIVYNGELLLQEA